MITPQMTNPLLTHYLETTANINYYISIDFDINLLLLLSGVFEKYFSENHDDNTFLINDDLSVYSNLNIKGYTKSDIEFLQGNDSNKFFEFNPKYFTELLKNKTTLSAIGNLTFNNLNEYIKPSIILSDEEKTFAELYIKKINPENKPILAIQPFTASCNNYFDPFKISFRDYFTRDLINRYKDSYFILQLHESDNCTFDNAYSLHHLSLRENFAMVSCAAKIITCDGMLQHIGAAFSIPSLVLWSVTDERIFGHPLHCNYKEHLSSDYIFPWSNEKTKIKNTINMYSEKTFEKIEEYLNA